MALPVISSGGIKAYCPDLIVDENTVIYFLLVAGYQTAVKGIIANILEYGSITAIVGDEYIYPQRSTLNYNVHYLRLPSGLFQGVIIPKIALPENKDPKDIFFVIAEDRSLAQDLFFRHLDDRTEVPLHQVWSHWLWDTFIKKDWVIPLETIIGDWTTMSL